MIIEYEGQRYDFAFEDITVKQAIKIERHTGMKMADWGKSLGGGGDLLAMQAMGWLILHGGRDVPIEDCDFKVAKLGEAFAKAAAAQEAREKAAEAADPTVSLTPPNGSGGASTPALSLPSPQTG